MYSPYNQDNLGFDLDFGNDKPMSIQICKLVVQDTGTYNQQFLRPYNTNIDSLTLNSIVDRFGNNNARTNVTPVEIADLSSNILRPQATPEKVAVIANGWNEKRVRFLLEALVTFNTGGRIMYYISGYTDFFGVGMNSLAPDMVFYVNSIVKAREQYHMSSFGQESFFNPIDACQIHCDNNWGGISQPGEHKLLRPMDVFNVMTTPHVMADAAFTNHLAFDTRNTITAGASTSFRANNLPSNYASRVIEAALKSSATAGHSASPKSAYEASSGYLRETEGYKNDFLKAISVVKGVSKAVNNFTYRDLIELDPNVQNVLNYAPLALGNGTAHSTGMTADWSGSDMSTVAATILAHALPAIMIGCGLTQVSFTSTNSNFGGVTTTAVTSANALTGGTAAPDLTLNCDKLILRLESEVLRDISYNGQEVFWVDMKVSLLGETWIKISVSNSPIYDYVAPSFCDSIFAPTVTTNNDLVNTVSSDFNHIVDNIHSALNSHDVPSFNANF